MILKKQILAMLLFSLLSISSTALANGDNEIKGSIIKKDGYESSTPKRIPIRKYDIILIINENDVIIKFSEDFGHGRFTLVDLTTNNEVADEIFATTDNIYSFNFDMNNITILDFNIEFEDGRWCHLTWSN